MPYTVARKQRSKMTLQAQDDQAESGSIESKKCIHCDRFLGSRPSGNCNCERAESENQPHLTEIKN
ncbi:hypothetical protein PAAG_12225 [Paracoccidioides lutzii Pb01]|uniref:Uncharacterized protein n=1 Tax=Paracoccidioides lutzii (strain ATCC MYA-826 / Pb01) TaxID=502779 RepID=A0A0A2V405_PARBA|nr:hypothetical protein PAAG_12225 [Paracoccidioides lutzii Pb01]KGQ01097.1 hypothetical protein PAAG_12225 [Paracoccidioides lutzii Pb01]